MTATLFLQYAAVANRLQLQPFAARSPNRPQAYKTWLGIVAALAIHIAWLTLLPAQEAETHITPPQPIMVNWINTAAAEAPRPPSAKPTPQPERPLKPAKPKPVAKVAKPKPVLATASDTASPMAIASSEPEPPAPQPAQAASTQTAPAGSTPGSSPDEGQQAPVTLPSLHADYLNNPAPAYPSQSRQLGEQGKVLLRVLVKADGNVEQVVLRKSSGYQRLDDAALDTVKQWRFVPAKRADQAIAAWVVVPISFSLEG